jgi:hypothetical protein
MEVDDEKSNSSESGTGKNNATPLLQLTVLCSVALADPDPGSGAFLTPGFGMGKKSRLGSGMNIPDHIS